jgi:hypothetical protein
VVALADAATGRLLVQGFEGSVSVTEIFNLPVAVGEQLEAV